MNNFKKSNIRIVLCNPQHPGNVGASIRAMVTMGFLDLVLVNPRHYPHDQIETLASDAVKYLNKIVVASSLTEGIADCQLVIGLSARLRDLSPKIVTPEACANICINYSQESRVALLFGAESTGLTNDELLNCHYQVIIPTDRWYSSINLSQAVQIMCYLLHSQALTTAQIDNAINKLASQKDMELFFKQLELVLKRKKFLDATNPRRLMHRLKRMFNRIQMETTELNILRGILASIEHDLNEHS